MKKFWRLLNDRDAIAGSLFWSWNTLFLLFMVLGFAPQMLPEMLNAAAGGEIPGALLAYAALLSALPLLAVVLAAAHPALRGQPQRLLALGYGVEGPLMMLVALRFFGVRQLTPALALLLGATAFGLLTYLWQLLDVRIDERGLAARLLGAIGMTVLLLVGLYAAVWLSFYILPGAALFLTNLPDVVAALARGLWHGLGDFWTALLSLSWSDLQEIPWLALPFFLLLPITLVYTGTLVVGLPIMLTWLYGRAWWRAIRSLGEAWGRRPALALAATVAALGLAALPLSNRQPQHEAFALLAEPPTNLAAAQALVAQSDPIRSGLLNSYLAPQRYLSAEGEVRHVAELYVEAFGLSQERAEGVRAAYETWAGPMLYQPVHAAEPSPADADSAIRRRRDGRAMAEEQAEAAELYARFFDEPIVEAEREVVMDAMRSSWSIDQARADWRAVDEREIHLLRQEISVDEQGDWAEIELYEVYQNMTFQREEVVYYLNLPESAVITGLWLGTSADRAARDTFRVTPRGAAQALYRNEVVRNVDPALIEQIGPRQYRLRAFPVEPRRSLWNENERRREEEGPPLHLWLTLRVLAEAAEPDEGLNGATAGSANTQPGAAFEARWPLPRLAEHRNVFWDETTERRLDGAPWPDDARPRMADEGADPGATWLPASVPASAPVTRRARRVPLPGGRAVDVQPVAATALPTLPPDLSLTVVLDRSRSMEGQRAALVNALAALSSALPFGDIQVLLSSSEFRGEVPSLAPLAAVDVRETLFFGGQNAAELLAQDADLAGDRADDAVLVLTDGSGYALTATVGEIAPPRAPVWLVHLGGTLPLGYDDATLDAVLASGGGVAGSVEEALTRIAAGQGSGDADWVDGYAWTMDDSAADRTAADRTADTTAESTAAATANSAQQRQASADEPAFAPFAARYHVLAETRRQREQLGAVETLDGIHALAVDAQIVTPYSSMIVLVTEDQQRLLDRLEKQSDRFDRELEAIGDTEGERAPVVTGVPEPETWLLLAMAAALLAVGARQRRLVAT